MLEPAGGASGAQRLPQDGREGSRRARGARRRRSAEVTAKVRKYNAAQVGLRAGPRRGRNDLFRVLREQGVACKAADDVDAALIRAAHLWIAGLPSVEVEQSRGCLVVVSQDSDFAPLLRKARDKGIIAVSAKPGQTSSPRQQQTSALAAASDIVLLQGDVELEEEADIDLFDRKAREYRGDYQLFAQTETGRRLLCELGLLD